MARFLPVSLFAFLVLAILLAHESSHGGEKSKDFSVKGTFTKDDPKDAERGGPSKIYTLPLKAGVVYTIDMQSTDFDSYLRLLDPKGKQLDQDDDSGGNLNSRIIFNCSTDGEYQVVATTFGADMKGIYTLQVRATGTVQKAATAHSQMLGKAAPDFNADFAVNGKAAKLSDLKGKVVLLYFWEVRSSSASAILPTLADWQKKHAAEGLTIVGATFYTHEIGQKLGWDKENAKVITAKLADRKSDQALLTAFAAHHKIEHLLLALPKQEALTAFDAYVVNSMPQVMLIDRKGMVRLIDIGGEKGMANVEPELKKLLAEK